MPTEKPILFNGDMVRAILSGQKTVTRRAVKGIALEWLRPEGFTPEFTADPSNDLCPYGQPGDRLWVRESFADLRGTGIEHRPDPAGPLQRYAFAADSPLGSASDVARKDFGVKWKPSIHMPRIACRILLEITAVRVERLQDISEEQCIQEGIHPVPKATEAGHQFWRDYHLSGDGTFCVRTPKESFKSLWCHVAGGSFPNGEAKYKASPLSWDANPWVWVVEFKRVKP